MQAKQRIWTIPNLMSLFRIVLIPLFVWVYLGLEQRWLAALVVALSGATDVLDGRIARRYNLVTDLGKLLDPLADKLTQFALIVCLAVEQPSVLLLLLLFVVKELFLGCVAAYVTHLTGQVVGAQWYGKVSTVGLFVATVALLVFPNMPPALAGAVSITAGALLLMSLCLYTRYYYDRLEQHGTPGPDTTKPE